MRRIRSLWSAALAVGVCGTLSAQTPAQPPVQPPQKETKADTPPAKTATTPAVGPIVPVPKDPLPTSAQTTPNLVSTNTNVLDSLAAQPSTSTRDYEPTTYAINMFGDPFNTTQYNVRILAGSVTAFSSVFDNTLLTRKANLNQPLTVVYNPGNSSITVIGNPTQAGLLGVPVAPGATRINLQTFNGSPQFTTTANYSTVKTLIIQSQNTGGPSTFGITDNATYLAAANTVLNKLYGPGGATVFNAAASNVVYQAPARATTANALGFGQANITYSYDRYENFSMPGPNGVVGRNNVSEENNPLPADRTYFDYDSYGGARIAGGSSNVNRITAGFEKTFLDRTASIEVRVPFASSQDPNSTIDGAAAGGYTTLGDVLVTLKKLIYVQENFQVSGGLGFSIPTAPNDRVSNANGGDALQITNGSFEVIPFLAFLYSPDDRWFMQFWSEVNIDTTGSGVSANVNGAGMTKIGRAYEQSLLSLDMQVGYWLIKPGTGQGWVKGLAPFAELHYNSALDNPTSLAANSFSFQPLTNNFDELNLTTGVAVQLRNNLLLSSALVLPLRGGADRSFDYQLGIRLDWFFGPSADRYSAWTAR